MSGAARGLARLRVLRLARKELRQLFRDPRTKRVIFAAPILQLVLLGYAVNTDVRNVDMIVLDRDRSAESRSLVERITASGYFRVVARAQAPGAVERALDRGEARVGLEIPAGFASDLASGRRPRVQILIDGSHSNTATVAQGYLVQILRGRDAGTAARGGIELRPRAWFNPALESQLYNVPAVIGVLLLFVTLLVTALAVVREREMGTLEQLLVSPVEPFELLLGKTLPVGSIALVQLLVTGVVAILWFDVPFRGSVVALLVASVPFIATGLSCGLLISTISRTQQEAFLGMFLFFLPTIILSGFLYPIEAMPRIFEILTWGNPLRHFLEIVRGSFLRGAGIGEMATSYGALLVLTAIAVGTALQRFTRTIRG